MATDEQTGGGRTGGEQTGGGRRGSGQPSTVVDDSLLLEAHRQLDDAVALRRRLHAYPEIGLDLPRTQGAIIDALDGLGLEISTGRATSSVVAVLHGEREEKGSGDREGDGGGAGAATLLRGDMDALPMPEDTGLEFASTVDGAMHACGHDAHVAMLVGAARLLVARRGDLTGRVVFMFQPGEEGFGGAKVMLDEGLIEQHGPFDRAFAIHATPLMASGQVATRGGTLMASADEFQVTVTGRGGHASMPHDAVDPVPVACEIVTALQTMVTRRVPAFDPAVVTVASIHAGTASNVIPEAAVLTGTVRAVSDESRVIALDGLRRVAENVAAAHLCRADVVATAHRYPVTVNDDLAADEALLVANALLGSARVRRMPTPVMGAEDWSYVLQQVRGSMVFLGTAPPGVAEPAPNHSNRMLLDEAAMATGIALHAAMALS